MKERISAAIDAAGKELLAISDYLYQHPELGYEERQACERLSGCLGAHGFSVEAGTAGIETAFTARLDSGRPGPRVAFLCEYDALPGIGHGCGHNAIGTMGVGAAVGLAAVIEEIGGAVLVYGTPAEETDGAKVHMVKAGVFDEADFAMMLHPDDRTMESGGSLAIDPWQFDYHGKTAHAAGNPEDGVNALDAVIQLFNGVNALRQHVKSDTRIHGIITHGGLAANIVPEFASARFYTRSPSRAYLDEVNQRVFAIAEAAAKMTGARLEISQFESSFDDMMTVSAMSTAWKENMILAGIPEVLPPQMNSGSMDMGNVSRVVPSIHPFIQVWDRGVSGHSREAAASTITAHGHKRILQGAKSMAFTGCDLITDRELAERVRREFEALSAAK